MLAIIAVSVRAPIALVAWTLFSIIHFLLFYLESTAATLCLPLFFINRQADNPTWANSFPTIFRHGLFSPMFFPILPFWEGTQRIWEWTAFPSFVKTEA